MKNIVRLALGLVLVFGLSIVLSSFASPGPVDNKGVVVEVVKDEAWALNTTCGWLPCQSTTTQYKDGVVHMRTTIYDLRGFCDDDIPEKAEKVVISDNYYILWTASGMVISKTKYN